ncbi:MAG: AmmeMemoRadiSam system protein B [Vicinamibacterales bacterium]
MIREPAVAGTWYPADPRRLAADLDRLLSSIPPLASRTVDAVLVPHAGLMYSGPVAAHAFRAVQRQTYDVVILLGPSHYVDFPGVALWPGGAFRTPLGDLALDRDVCESLLRASPIVAERIDAHEQEHALELQLPFLAHLFPHVPIVPLVMGRQTRATVTATAEAIGSAVTGRRALLIGSTDLSHFFDAATADSLDRTTAGFVANNDPHGLLGHLERYSVAERGRYVMCGGGPAVAIMLAARHRGASWATILERTHSGVVSGDMHRVVGYLAAAMGRENDTA